jgi:cytidyltransferase-like protein
MTNHKKIKNIEELSKVLTALRTDNKKIVHCHGVFDLLHIGHIRHLEQARHMGDVLIVTVTPDRYVEKGPGHPAFTEGLRAEAIASLNCVDYVVINRWPTAEETLRLLKPDFYVRGSGFKDMPVGADDISAREECVAAEVGVALAFTEDITFRSSTLINRYLSNLSEEMHEYLGVFRKRYPQQELMKVLDDMQGLNVLVIGDTILDEYQYCEAIGKSSKDPVLALKYQSHDLFAGGVLAVANHVANFAGSVKLVTILGEQDSHEEFIRSQLSPAISPCFIVQRNAPTLIKRRFIECYSLNKLFEVYVMDNSGLTVQQDRDVCAWLGEHLQDYDMVIAADFGHGAISESMVETLAKHASFLAVNTQANAGNRGFHTISRYPRADYACIAEHEIRLETRTLDGDLRPLMNDIAGKLDCRRFVVTRGRKGAVVRNHRGEFVEVPSFATNIVDRVGAGDAFFSITALAAAQGAPDEVLGFIGNIVGALAVEVVGNKKSIDKSSTRKYIESILK